MKDLSLLLIDRDLSTDRDWSLLDAAQSSDLMVFIGELASPLLAIAPSREPPRPTNRTKQKALFMQPKWLFFFLRFFWGVQSLLDVCYCQYKCHLQGHFCVRVHWASIKACKVCWEYKHVVLQCQDLVHDRKASQTIYTAWVSFVIVFM